MLKTIKGLQGVNILSKDAQKKVFGGNAPATCAVYLPPGTGTGTASNPTQWGGTGGIGYSSATSVNGTLTFYGVSAADAQAQAVGAGAHWCCSSCSGASWYSPA